MCVVQKLLLFCYVVKCLNDTELLTIPVQSFALTHTLMYGAVRQMTNLPLYYTRDVTYSHLAVDVIREFTVLYLYSGRQLIYFTCKLGT